MAFTNQFSLSLELTKLIPFGSVLSGASRGMLHLMRELKDSGSDIITEADLAEVFGRNRIEEKFASTFRTAVRKSAIHKISDIAELVIEAGAGPTVRRSLSESAYFSTVVQLSLLTYTHDLSQLARCLAKALENRAEGATESVGIPRHDALKGTLRACREQTSGFMWELLLLPVEKQLAHIPRSDGPWINRQLPVSVLQALLDSFTAVQYLPENRFIRIESSYGSAAIVVWAHHLLGLSVCVQYRDTVVRFGEGVESVYIDAGASKAKASLVNETQELIFQVVESNEDLPLDAACRHPVFGYGNRSLGIQQYGADVIKSLAHITVTSCISLVQFESAKQRTLDVDLREQDIFPPAERILGVGKMLFPDYDDMFDEIDLTTEQPCLAPSDWKRNMLPGNLAQGLSRASMKNCTLMLSHLLLILSMIDNVDECGMLPLDLYVLKKEHFLPFRLPNAREAFETIGLLLQGRALNSDDAETKRIAVLSAWGWSLCVSSIVDLDPSEARPGVVVLQGVPMRTGERKRLIVDIPGSLTMSATDRVLKYEKNRYAKYEGNHITVAQAGDKVELGSWTRPKKTRYFISVNDTAFEVSRSLSSEPVGLAPFGDRSIEKNILPYAGELRAGFRHMQEMYWNSVCLQTCDHPAWLGQIITLPRDTWVFHGLDEPARERFIERLESGPEVTEPSERIKCEEGSVHAGLVAGDSSARWILLGSMLTWKVLVRENTAGSAAERGNEAGEENISMLNDSVGRQMDGSYRDGMLVPEPTFLPPAKQPPGPTVLLRGTDCCFQCAIDIAQKYRQGQHVGLVL
ncbi:hypothetical protein MMC29_002363 [Sticta canariensis]|nr:hypothetical protein [Sticta canariensis]